MTGGVLLGLIFLVGGAHAGANLDVQLLFKNSVVESEISWVHLCAQPAHVQSQSGPSSCLYGEFSVEPIAMKRGSSENYHFLNLLPKDVFQLVVEVTSEEDSKSTKRVVITFPKTLSVTDSPSTVDVYKSDSISLSLRYKITSNCEAGMYGESCEHQCVLPRQQVTAGCKYSCNYLGDVVCVNEQPQVQMLESNTGEDAGMFHREKRQSGNNSGGLDSSTVIAISVVTVLGCWLLMVIALIILFVFCFVTCDKERCRPKITRKPCSSDVAQKCCESCIDRCCVNDNDIAFWATLILLAVVCFPFAVCCLVLYGLTSAGGQ